MSDTAYHPMIPVSDAPDTTEYRKLGGDFVETIEVGANGDKREILKISAETRRVGMQEE